MKKLMLASIPGGFLPVKLLTHTLCGGLTLFSFHGFKHWDCCCDLITNQIFLLYGGVDYHFVGHEKSVVV